MLVVVIRFQGRVDLVSLKYVFQASEYITKGDAD